MAGWNSGSLENHDNQAAKGRRQKVGASGWRAHQEPISHLSSLYKQNPNKIITQLHQKPINPHPPTLEAPQDRMCIVLCLLVNNSASAPLQLCLPVLPVSSHVCGLLSFLVHVSLLSLSSQSSSLEGREGPTIHYTRWPLLVNHHKKMWWRDIKRNRLGCTCLSKKVGVSGLLSCSTPLLLPISSPHHSALASSTHLSYHTRRRAEGCPPLLTTV